MAFHSRHSRVDKMGYECGLVSTPQRKISGNFSSDSSHWKTYRLTGSFKSMYILYISENCSAPTKAVSGRPAYSPALCQIKFAMAKLLVSSPGQNPGRSSRGNPCMVHKYKNCMSNPLIPLSPFSYLHSSINHSSNPFMHALLSIRTSIHPLSHINAQTFIHLYIRHIHP